MQLDRGGGLDYIRHPLMMAIRPMSIDCNLQLLKRYFASPRCPKAGLLSPMVFHV